MANQSVIETARKYVRTIPEDLGVKKAFLFGSYAGGSEREESDIDIAIILENMQDFFVTQKLLMKLRWSIDPRIEPHPIKAQDFNSSNPFAIEINRTGIEIV
jgi:predicted nucleotidyltransferase